MFDGVLYAKENDQLILTLEHTGTPPSGCTHNGFSATTGTLIDGTLTMSDANTAIYATYTTDSADWGGSGAGTSDNPYIINSTELWDEFANRVNYGQEGFANAYYRLDEDIIVTTMVGTDGFKFKGHFDGNSHKLTLSYGTQAAPIDENYCAPFRYVDGAVIHDLNVDGTIYTDRQFAAGIAGFAVGTNSITNCRVSVDINSNVDGDGTHGGFVANNTGGALTISNSAFNGSMTGSNTYNCGGFVGWNETDNSGSVSLTNCLFKPSTLTISTSGGANFARGRNSNTDGISLTGCYYTSAIGSVQGELAYTTDPSISNIPSAEISIAGINFYVAKTILSNVTATDITSNQATISWTGDEVCSKYQVHYRVKNDVEQYSYFTDFEDGQPEGWTMIDADGDGENWEYHENIETAPHSGKGCFTSVSYINYVGSLEPDNWLVSPELNLGGTLRVWLKGKDINDYKEHFAIYLSTDGHFVDASNHPLNSLITLVPETETTNEYQEYTADLSSYNGQQGYIAIRHFNCSDQFYIVLDDFGIENSSSWTTVDANAAGATITDLESNTTYEYQVVYTYGGTDFYSSISSLTTPNDNTAPTDLSVTNLTANTANISWTAFSDSYNVRYVGGGVAKVTLSVPNKFWDDNSGYQMLLDADHNTYGSVIPVSGPLTEGGDVTDETYDYFEYKIPEGADGKLDSKYMVDGAKVQSVTITIPAGIYDWCITNPSPNDRMWIASGNGNVGGRKDDFIFEGGKHYTFTVTEQGSNDCVNMTVDDDETLDQGDMMSFTNITSTSYVLSGLTASTFYTVYVQSVKNGKTSEWSSTTFTTTDETNIGLADASDNSSIIEANLDQMRNATLAGRTLYKDGAWNTLCLPFAVSDGDTTDDLTFSGTPLEGAIVMELDTDGSYANDEGNPQQSAVNHKTGLAPDGTLYLYFKSTAAIEAGKPYVIKWENGEDLENPVFTGVTIANTAATTVTAANSGLSTVQFIGTYSPVALTGGDTSSLFLGSDNTLYYPSEAMNINACRAYFHVDLTGSVNAIRAMVLRFGDGEATGIVDAEANSSFFTLHSSLKDKWFTLDGRQLDGQP